MEINPPEKEAQLARVRTAFLKESVMKLSGECQELQRTNAVLEKEVKGIRNMNAAMMKVSTHETGAARV
nr:hypothetical protein BaRGS_031713 [Batillaria attramentaria]